MQLEHSGREANFRAKLGDKVYAPSSFDFGFLDYDVEELSDAEIHEVIRILVQQLNGQSTAALMVLKFTAPITTCFSNSSLLGQTVEQTSGWSNIGQPNALHYGNRKRSLPGLKHTHKRLYRRLSTQP